MPFHPEELHKHVKQLEVVYAAIPAADWNARVAVAKAIIAANASLVEGCLDYLAEYCLAEIGVPQSVRLWVTARLRGLNDKMDFLHKQLAGSRAGWQVKDGPPSRFVEGRLPGNRPGLPELRNRIDHGDVVEQMDLRLHAIGEFRKLACEYLEEVYLSMKVVVPGWLGT